MKIRTRAFLLGLIPALLLAAVLTAFHVHSRLSDLDQSLSHQGMALARHLGGAAEYGVVSGNDSALDMLLEQVMIEPGVESAQLFWPEGKRMIRGEAVEPIPLLTVASQWQDAERSWFAHPVRLSMDEESDLYFEGDPASREPLAWVVVGIDREQKRYLVNELLLASFGITLLGVLLAVLLIQELALTGIRPLMEIIATVKRISSGAFGTRLEVTAHSPELRELQAMINQMSESLRSYQQDMEARVHMATAELEHKKREAEQANQAKSRFLAAASHDLRQPMHAISLYVESLKPQLQGRSEAEILQKLERSILGMVEMFNAILDVSKLDAGVIQPRLGPIRIRQLLLYLADEFAAEADSKGLSLRVRVPDVWVQSDAVLLERIIRNLLSNALRYTTQGGILLSAKPHQGKLRLQVWDTGKGIATEHQPNIFYEFYQVGSQSSQEHQGLGLGLSIVRRLARLLGYPLQLHSRPGRGTVFALDVPVMANAPAVIDAPYPYAGDSLQGCAIVIDDDPDVRDALGRLLSQWGLKVQLFEGLEAVRKSLHFAPDIVLADYQLLDDETGTAAIEAIRAQWGQTIPAILITGDTRASTVQMLESLGLPVLYKPIQPAHLLSLLRQSLGRGREARDTNTQKYG
jgi:two-component system, sensor histidine kinase